MKTFLGKEIPKSTKAVLYLCEYDYEKPSITVIKEIFYNSVYDGMEAYSNICNPESQIAIGNSQEELYKELTKLHSNLNSKEWLIELKDYL